jgi:Leucine-rich repeat (LRR) protein
VFSHLCALRILGVSHNKIGEIKLGTFHNLTAVEKVWAESNWITVFNSASFDNLPRLLLLSLQYNKIKEMTTDKLKNIPDAPVKVLYLGGNLITNLQTHTLTWCTDVRDLDLRNNTISILLAGVFFRHKHLEKLHLNDKQNQATWVSFMEPFAVTYNRHINK